MTLDDAVKATERAICIAENGRMRPMPLVHEGARAYLMKRDKHV